MSFSSLPFEVVVIQMRTVWLGPIFSVWPIVDNVGAPVAERVSSAVISRTCAGRTSKRSRACAVPQRTRNARHMFVTDDDVMHTSIRCAIHLLRKQSGSGEFGEPTLPAGAEWEMLKWKICNYIFSPLMRMVAKTISILPRSLCVCMCVRVFVYLCVINSLASSPLKSSAEVRIGVGSYILFLPL